MTSAECFRCGSSASNTFGNGYICGDCIPENGDSLTDSETSSENTSDITSKEDEDSTECLGLESGVFPVDLLDDVEQWHTSKTTNDGRKVPRAPYTNPEWPDKFVSAQNPAIWTDFDIAKQWAEKLPSHSLAFNIRDREDHPDEEFVLIDYDDARNPEAGEIHPVVREHLRRAGSYADVSTSGTGVHIFARGTLPDGVKAIDASLPPADEFDDAEIEVYDSARYSVMTGNHIVGMPTETTNCQAFINDLADEFATVAEGTPNADEFATVAEGTPNELTRAPEKSREELTDVETTTNMQDVLDAIQHTRPRDIRLRSTVTQERADGSKSLNPSWAISESGTRLAQVGDGWVYRKGMHGLDALQVVALEERIIHSEDDYPSGEAFWQAVDALRDRGAHIPEYEPAEVEPSPALALKRLEALDGRQRERYRRSFRGQGVPSTDQVSDRIRAELEDVLKDENYAVLRAPTGSNKTGVAAETIWRLVDEDVTGDRPVVLLTETCDARGEAVERARAADLDILVLKGYKELCGVARGDYDPENIDDEDPDAPEPVVIDGKSASEWFTEQVEQKGRAISAVHSDAEELLRQQGQECPCCEGDYTCPTKTQWPEDGFVDDGPRYDLVIATDPFAFVPSLRTETNIIHDEQPDYGEDFGLEVPDETNVTTRVRETITAFLGLSDVGPDTYEGLVELARACARCDATPWNEQAPPDERPDEVLGRRWIKTFDALEYKPGQQWYREEPRAHTLAPALARAIWKAITTNGAVADVTPDERGAGVFDSNGRASSTVSHSPPRLDEDARDGNGWNRTYVTVTIDDENTIRGVRNAPDFSTARSVVGLDARPTPWLWQRNVHPDITIRRVLEPDEARRWRRYERGQTVVQVGDATRPVGSEGKYFNECHARAIVERLREHSGDEFRGIGTAKATEGDLRAIMRDVGIPEDELATLHYGEEKSRNPEGFADALAGLVYGCIDPGDDYVLDLLAECGLDAEPERSADPCEDCDGDGCHSCDGMGHKRAHGRGFVGPDAEHAAELLESVRATHVAQMIGRFGRDLDVENGERNLTFVATDAVSSDLVDYQVPGVEWLATDLQREILETLRDRPEATTRELGEALDCGKEHVRQTLVRLEERGITERRRGSADHGADQWHADADASIDGVQLRLDEIANYAVQDSRTWLLAVSDVHADQGSAAADSSGGTTGFSHPTPQVDPPDEAG